MIGFRRLLAAALVFGAPAHAAVISPHAESVAVTLYHEDGLSTSELLHSDKEPWIRDQGLAFITETRTIDLPAGPAIVKFQGVAASMVPQSAEIQGLPTPVREQNFDYDLLSPGSLLAKSVGETVQLVRTDPKTGKTSAEDAIIRSGPEGAVLDINGRYEALHCSGLPEKLVYSHIPEGLAATPTLSLRTDAPAAGHFTIRLSYIATGLNWTADYVARIDPGTDKLALNGWLTLANFSTTSFLHAPVSVVAGHLQATGNDTPADAEAVQAGKACWPTEIDWATRHPSANTFAPLDKAIPPPPFVPSPAMVVVTAEKRIEAQRFGDYKLYPLPEPTTVAAQQTKQVQFLAQSGVPFERVYRFDVARTQGDAPVPAAIILRLRNRDDSGLGKPLPAGGVSVFEHGADAAPVFIGHDAIRDMTVGSDIEIETGHAMAVMAAPRLTHTEKSGDKNNPRTTEDWEVTLTNRKSTPATFELRQYLYDSAADIRSDSDRHAEKSGYAVWTIALAPGEDRIVRYRISVPG